PARAAGRRRCTDMAYQGAGNSRTLVLEKSAPPFSPAVPRPRNGLGVAPAGAELAAGCGACPWLDRLLLRRRAAWHQATVGRFGARLRLHLRPAHAAASRPGLRWAGAAQVPGVCGAFVWLAQERGRSRRRLRGPGAADAQDRRDP